MDRLPPGGRAVIRTCLYGLAAGAAVVAFQIGIGRLHELTIVRFSRQSAIFFAGASLATILGTALVAGLMLNYFCREAAGSGIPQLKAAFWTDFGCVPWRVAWVKFVAGVLTIGGGSSLGREGPSVQVGGAIGSNVAWLLGVPKHGRRVGAAAGAAAGLAAAFNTPLAAMTFVLEEIVLDLNSRLLGSVALASVMGALVVHGVLGKQPAFDISPAGATGWRTYGLVIITAVLSALAGICFQKLTLLLRQHSRKGRLSRIPAWLQPAVGAFVTWCLGTVIFLATGRLGVFGLGYADLSAALTNRLDWRVACLLLPAKLLATAFSYAFGGCGGIFAPSLFFGGMCGLMVSGIAGHAAGLTGPDQVLLTVVGMTACLGAVVRAPVTSILIVFEMTREFEIIPPLMISALVSQSLSRLMSRRNFYDAALEQDGHAVEQIRPPRDLSSWQQWPVSAIANCSPVAIARTDPEEIKRVLSSHRYQRFPVARDGRIIGILTRHEAEESLRSGIAPRIEHATTCDAGAMIRDAERLLVQSPTNMILITAGREERLVGLLTLHDLVRAQMAWGEADQNGEDACMSRKHAPRTDQSQDSGL